MVTVFSRIGHIIECAKTLLFITFGEDNRTTIAYTVDGCVSPRQGVCVCVCVCALSPHTFLPSDAFSLFGSVTKALVLLIQVT